MVSFSQLLLVILVGFLLFGNLPKRAQEFAKAFNLAKKEISSDSNSEKKKENHEKGPKTP